MWKRSIATLLFAPFALSVAAVAESTEFRSPSGNILCSFSDYENVQGVRCDIINHADLPPLLPVPKDCDLDWGNMFIVGKKGKAGLECAGDLAANPTAPPLGYGKSISNFGITCTSTKSGMTCKNSQGHGFSVSRSKQRLF
jgi:hypothetical protein